MSLLTNRHFFNGTYTATVTDYHEVNPTYNDDGTLRRQGYLSVDIELDHLETIEARWYPKRIGYIIRCLSKQADRYFCNAAEALEWASKHEFFVECTVDPKWGQQIDYEL